eukprot:TRINITY_DN1051_c6_g1_i1.p1 TRINITY_DN1051_c6_g1~~TRINITY_DN1051_c6_g1_i1.p1  ORF type:complete len:411 (+),score=52.45 TRINITY_DN1051_c6_g1_i1:43-1233(+)
MIIAKICGDICSRKVNLEVELDLTHGVKGVHDTICKLMDEEAATLVGSGKSPPFSIYSVQFFDDRVFEWVDFVDCKQLFAGVQLYAFQPETSWHVDVQMDLPPAKPRKLQRQYAPTVTIQTTPRTAHASREPRESRTVRPVSSSAPLNQNNYKNPYAKGAVNFNEPTPTGTSKNAIYRTGRDGATQEEKISYIFDTMDDGEKNYITHKEFKTWMQDMINLPDSTLESLFAYADANRDGVITRDELNSFSHIFPNVSNICFHHAADRYDVTSREMEIKACQQRLSQNQELETDLNRQVCEIQERLRGIQCENEDIMNRINTNMDLNQSVAVRHVSMEAEEQSLMEREISVQQNEDALRSSKNLFFEQTQRYDKAASAFGSPQRTNQHYSTSSSYAGC